MKEEVLPSFFFLFFLLFPLLCSASVLVVVVDVLDVDASPLDLRGLVLRGEDGGGFAACSIFSLAVSSTAFSEVVVVVMVDCISSIVRFFGWETEGSSLGK